MRGLLRLAFISIFQYSFSWNTLISQPCGRCGSTPITSRGLMLPVMLYTGIPAPLFLRLSREKIWSLLQAYYHLPQNLHEEKNTGPWAMGWVLCSQKQWQNPSALGFRLITPVQLPLADHPLQVISTSPTVPCCSWVPGEGIYPL